MKKIIINALSFLKKLKFLDYLIIIFVFLALVLFYRFIHQEKKWINVTVISRATNFYVNSLHIGDFETDSSGKKIAEVTDFRLVDAPNTTNPFANKILLLDLKILVNSSSRVNYFEYKNQPVGVGSGIQFNFNYTSVDAFVTNIGESSVNKNTETKILTIRIYNQWPWYADSIKIGDSYKNVNGEKTIEVISKEVNPAQNPITTAGNQQLIGNVDIVLRVRAKLEKTIGGYLFQGYNNIFIGDTISFTAGNNRVQGFLVNIE